MAGKLNKGITLGFKTDVSSTYTVLKCLQEYPDLGGTPETVDATTFDDNNVTYINGLPDYGTLEFTFLDDTGLEGSSYEKLLDIEDTEVTWQVTIPCQNSKKKTFTFPGMGHLIEKGSAPNGALQYGLSIVLTGSSEKDVE
jgi:hypothetical protein